MPKQENMPLTTARLIIAALLIFAAMALFCALSPWVFDDFGYGAGSSSLAALFSAQIQEHLSWSGKFIGHFMARVLLHGPAFLHPLLSPLVFLGLLFSGLILILGPCWRKTIRAWQIILLFGLLWFSIPAFGTVFFWRTGTPDYGYGLFWGTAFLIPYRFLLTREAQPKKAGLWRAALFAIFGLLAGLSNENVGALAILLALLASLCHFRAARKIPLWAASGIIGAIIGWLLMLSAPGNAIRLASLGGTARIPLLSLPAFERFLSFLGSQELELAPYILINLVSLYILHRQKRLTLTAALPGLAFFLISQASLAAFILSPSTPYRAMTATFFFQSLSSLAFILALNCKNLLAKAIYLLFCAVFLASLLAEIGIFIENQPAIAARDSARTAGSLNASHFNYPRTDKYFFLTYDIIEINQFPDAQKSNMIPWDKAIPVKRAGADPVNMLVFSNMVYLDKLPQGKVLLAARARQNTLASKFQCFLRRFFPLGQTATTPEILARYAVASASSPDGKAALHIPGVAKIDDIAFISLGQAQEARTWKRLEPEPAKTE